MSWYNFKTTPVTLTLTGSTVTLKRHGFAAGTMVRFASVTGITNITVNNTAYAWYYVVTPLTDTFQLATVAGGTALSFTGANGTGELALLDYVSRPVTLTVTGSLVNYTAHPYVRGSKIRFLTVTNTTGITAPATPSSGSYTWYYATSILPNSFQLTTTWTPGVGGAAGTPGTPITFGGVNGSARIAIDNSPVVVKSTRVTSYQEFMMMIILTAGTAVKSAIIGKASIPFFSTIGTIPKYGLDGVRKFTSLNSMIVGTSTNSFFSKIGTIPIYGLDGVRKFTAIIANLVGSADDSLPNLVLARGGGIGLIDGGGMNTPIAGLADVTTSKLELPSAILPFVGINSLASIGYMAIEQSKLIIPDLILPFQSMKIGKIINTYTPPSVKDTWDKTVQVVVNKLIQFWS
jgi:hypothetical protein